MIVMGNVTVRNAPPFSSARAASTSTFQVYCPGYTNVYASVIVKTQLPDASTSFDIRTTDPPEGSGSWDSNQWARTSSAPQQC